MRRAGDAESPVVVEVRQAEPAVLLVDLHPEGADVAEALYDVLGDLGVALDLEGVDLLAEELLELCEERLALAAVGFRDDRVGMDQVEPEPPHEQLLAEARPGPLLLPGGFCDLPGFFLGGRAHGGTS